MPKLSRKSYKPDEKARFVAEVERLRATGMTFVAACRKLGISDKSLRLWAERANRPVTSRPSPAMRPVEITALVPAVPAEVPPGVVDTPLSLVTPGGYRVEGLSVAAAAELLRALG